ncbi:MAG: acyl-CoA dehydrogenase family protein, partial [Syntrophaceae bacterium]|nr:acyl-CoA dehydrogenase family protein [Syntrophaceae bacterium]
MIDYELTNEQKDLQGRMTAFCRAEIAPAAAELDAAAPDKVPEMLRARFRKLAGAGYFDLLLKSDFVSQCVAGEELAKACPATFLAAMSSGTAFGMALSCFGSQAQKSRFLPGIGAGETIGALACTETEAGSDLSGMATKAEKKGEQWILTGSKDLVTNAPVADAFLVLAWTDREAGLEKGLSLFLVEKVASGLSVGPTLETMGLRGAPTAGISLTGCTVSADALVGEVGGGYALLGRITEWIKISLSAMSVGLGVACMEVSTGHGKGKKAFGKPIGLFEGVGAKLAVMFTLNDLGRMMTLRAAWSTDHQETEAPILTASAKLFTSESVNKIADLAMQVHGGHGYVKGPAVERLYRDARFAELAYGTSEMQRAFIARDSLNRY